MLYNTLSIFWKRYTMHNIQRNNLLLLLKIQSFPYLYFRMIITNMISQCLTYISSSQAALCVVLWNWSLRLTLTFFTAFCTFVFNTQFYIFSLLSTVSFFSIFHVWSFTKDKSIFSQFIRLGFLIKDCLYYYFVVKKILMQFLFCVFILLYSSWICNKDIRVYVFYLVVFFSF